MIDDLRLVIEVEGCAEELFISVHLRYKPATTENPFQMIPGRQHNLWLQKDLETTNHTNGTNGEGEPGKPQLV
jgi:hypothetical protein